MSGRLKANESVLIHAAAGGVGSAAVQLAQAAGARVFATAGGAEKCAWLRKLGADVVVDYKSQDFAQVMIGCLRSLGLPARYVSGYLRNDPPPGQPRLIGADVSQHLEDMRGMLGRAGRRCVDHVQQQCRFGDLFQRGAEGFH